MTADPDAAVRLEAVLALGDVRTAKLEAEITAALARVGREDAGERWIASALLSSLRGREAAFIDSLLGEKPRPVDPELLHEAARLAGADPGTDLASLLRRSVSSFDGSRRSLAFAVAAGLAAGLARGGKNLREMPNVPDDAARDWRRLVAAARTTAEESMAPRQDRLRAVAVLAFAPWEEAKGVLGGLLDPRVDLDLELEALKALAKHASAEVAALLLGAWPHATPAVRGLLIDGLGERRERLPALLEALRRGEIDASDIDATRRTMLLLAASPETRRDLEGLLGGGTPERAAERERLLDRYRRELAAEGDRSRGAALFASRCAPCHRFSGQGHAVGPDLAGIGKKSREEILVSLLDPNRAAVPGYSAYVIVLETGEVRTGILASETGQAVTLRQAGGAEERLARRSIQSIAATGKSLMPEGLERDLTPRDVADVMAYLRQGAN